MEGKRLPIKVAGKFCDEKREVLGNLPLDESVFLKAP